MAYPPTLETVLPEGTVVRFEDGSLRITVSLEIYGLEAIFRTCYWFTDRAYIYLAPDKDRAVEITILARQPTQVSTDLLAWDFLNGLIDHRQRLAISEETRAIQELIVAQAFADTDLIDDRGHLLRPSKSGS